MSVFPPPQLENHFGPNCSFWNATGVSGSGRWSTQGCRLLHTNNTHTTCACNHLSSYAILMTYQQPAVSHLCQTKISLSQQTLLSFCGVFSLVEIQLVRNIYILVHLRRILKKRLNYTLLFTNFCFFGCRLTNMMTKDSFAVNHDKAPTHRALEKL